MNKEELKDCILEYFEERPKEFVSINELGSFYGRTSKNVIEVVNELISENKIIQIIKNKKIWLRLK